MKVTRKQLLADNLQSLNWRKDELVDWISGGVIYKLTGEIIKKEYFLGFGYRFDAAKTSKNGIYAVVYEHSGTKALLLKNGELLRELNRSYYCAEVYEYPIEFFEHANGKTLLIHCPKEYGRIEFEDAESGEILTDTLGRNPIGLFHSRLKVSASNTLLLSRGWVWHPLEFVKMYNIDDCLKNPLLLDGHGQLPHSSTEVCAGDFISDNLILLGTSDELSYNYGDEDYDAEEDLLPPKHIGIWDITEEKIISRFNAFDKGLNLIVINENYAWDIYRYPKLINISSGIIELKFEDIDSSTESSPIKKSPIGYNSYFSYNDAFKTLAIGNKNKIELLQFME